MRQRMLPVVTSVWIFFLLGFIFHTSANHTIFNKYSPKYFIFIVLFVILIYPLKKTVDYIFVRSTLRFRGKKEKLSSTKKILLMLIFFIIVFLLPAEIFLRNKYRNYESSSYTYTLDNFHPFLQSQIAKQENLTVNSLGFRGEEISKKKSQGTYRIAVLGGSTVLNREVRYEENAVRLLEKRLRLQYPERKIEVINAGKDYYTSEHSIILYMFKIKDLDPDLVIMWHGVNDMLASCLSDGIATHGSYKSDYSHMYGAESRIIFNYFRPQPVVQIKLLSLDFLIKNISDNIYSDLASFKVDKYRKVAASNYLAGKNTVSIHDYPSISAYSRNLQYLVRMTKDDNIPLIIGNQPSLLKKRNSVKEVEAIMFPAVSCSQNGKYYSLESLKFGLDIFNAVTKKVASENDVGFVDLDQSVPKNLSYFVDTVHYTDKGNEAIADTLFKYIVTKDLIQ